MPVKVLLSDSLSLASSHPHAVSSQIIKTSESGPSQSLSWITNLLIRAHAELWGAWHFLAEFKQINCLILASQSFPLLVCSSMCPNELVISIPSLQSCTLSGWGVTLLCGWSHGAAKACSCELRGSRALQLRAQPRSEDHVARAAGGRKKVWTEPWEDWKCKFERSEGLEVDHENIPVKLT